MLAASFIALATASLAAAVPLTRRAGEFGTCADPTIKFAPASDRGGADAFQPSSNQFVHGSALNIGVIAAFICQQLQSPCGASAAGLSACASAQKASTGLSGQAAADAFNAAITGGAAAAAPPAATAAAPAASDPAAAPAGCTASTVTVTAAAAGATPAPAAASPAAPPPAAASSAAPAAAAGGNLQTFTGALGGATAPPVTVGGRAFQVQGSDSFLNVGAALGRSCDIQHNLCANKANSGGGFAVSACDSQNTACHAAIQ